MFRGFNTASGKRCCNVREVDNMIDNMIVSIPQAVSAVATPMFDLLSDAGRFNTASGKRCCNSRVWKANIYAVPKASFGKPQIVNGNFSPH